MIEDLTPRQLEILSMVKRNMSNEDIARKLKLSISTINITLHNAYKVMGVVMSRKKKRRSPEQIKSDNKTYGKITATRTSSKGAKKKA